MPSLGGGLDCSLIAVRGAALQDYLQRVVFNLADPKVILLLSLYYRVDRGHLS